jgi:hypothetical protein
MEYLHRLPNARMRQMMTEDIGLVLQRTKTVEEMIAAKWVLGELSEKERDEWLATTKVESAEGVIQVTETYRPYMIVPDFVVKRIREEEGEAFVDIIESDEDDKPVKVKRVKVVKKPGPIVA